MPRSAFQYRVLVCFLLLAAVAHLFGASPASAQNLVRPHISLATISRGAHGLLGVQGVGFSPGGSLSIEIAIQDGDMASHTLKSPVPLSIYGRENDPPTAVEGSVSFALSQRTLATYATDGSVIPARPGLSLVEVGWPSSWPVEPGATVSAGEQVLLAVCGEPFTLRAQDVSTSRWSNTVSMSLTC